MKSTIQNSVAALDWLAMLTGKPVPKLGSKPTNRLLRDRLPDPITYYAGQGLKLRGRGAWRNCLCPFHEEKRPSFGVHVESGRFRCQACNVKGGDVLSFHRQRYNLSFKEAARDLGAWEVK